MPLLGAYNVRNALAAIAVGAAVGLDTDTMAEGLRKFRGRAPADAAPRHGGRRDGLRRLRASSDRDRGDAGRGPLRASRHGGSGRSSSRDRRPRAGKIFQADFARALGHADRVILPAVFRSTLPEDQRLSAEGRRSRISRNAGRRRPLHSADRRDRPHRRRARRSRATSSSSCRTAASTTSTRSCSTRSRRARPGEPMIDFRIDRRRGRRAAWSSCRRGWTRRSAPASIAMGEHRSLRAGRTWSVTRCVGYHTLTVYFDPLRVDGRWLEEQLALIAADAAAPTPRRPGPRSRCRSATAATWAPISATSRQSAGCSEQEVDRAPRIAVTTASSSSGSFPASPTWGRWIRGSRCRAGATPRTRVPAGIGRTSRAGRPGSIRWRPPAAGT